jgi:hydroxypyruvate isomerase
LKTRLTELDYAGQQYILRLFVERITLFHKQGYAEVVFKFPTHTALPSDIPVSVSQGNQMRLVLHVKILTEKERQSQRLKSNPAMYKQKLEVTA